VDSQACYPASLRNAPYGTALGSRLPLSTAFRLGAGRNPPTESSSYILGLGTQAESEYPARSASSVASGGRNPTRSIPTSRCRLGSKDFTGFAFDLTASSIITTVILGGRP
jgi:hypothetical protein